MRFYEFFKIIDEAEPKAEPTVFKGTKANPHAKLGDTTEKEFGSSIFDVPMNTFENTAFINRIANKFASVFSAVDEKNPIYPLIQKLKLDDRRKGAKYLALLYARIANDILFDKQNKMYDITNDTGAYEVKSKLQKLSPFERTLFVAGRAIMNLDEGETLSPKYVKDLYEIVMYLNSYITNNDLENMRDAYGAKDNLLRGVDAMGFDSRYDNDFLQELFNSYQDRDKTPLSDVLNIPEGQLKDMFFKIADLPKEIDGYPKAKALTNSLIDAYIGDKNENSESGYRRAVDKQNKIVNSFAPLIKGMDADEIYAVFSALRHTNVGLPSIINNDALLAAVQDKLGVEGLKTLAGKFGFDMPEKAYRVDPLQAKKEKGEVSANVRNQGAKKGGGDGSKGELSDEQLKHFGTEVTNAATSKKVSGLITSSLKNKILTNDQYQDVLTILKNKGQDIRISNDILSSVLSNISVAEKGTFKPSYSTM